MEVFIRIFIGFLLSFSSLKYYVESEQNAVKINNQLIHNGTKRVTISSDDKKKALIAFMEALGSFTDETITSIPIPLVPAFYKFFKSLLTGMHKDRRSLWDKIRNQVQHTIDRSNAEIDLGHVDRELRKVERRIREGNFTQCDYEATIDLMEEVFPHKREEVGWHDELPLRSLYYVSLIIQVYNIRIEQGAAERCSLGKRLLEIRQEVIFGMKEMIRKRYRQVQDSDWKTSVERPTVIFTIGSSGTSFNASIIETKSVITFRKKIKFKFGTTKRVYPIYNYYSWNHQIRDVENKAISYLYKEVVVKLNSFFKTDICLKGCECPTPITKEEIILHWPSECMGVNPSDESKKCGIPCGKYSEDDNWCYESKKISTSESIKDCKPVDIRCCIKMPYDTRSNRCNASKKKI